MQAVQYRNTMASARFKPAVADDGVRRFDMIEARRIRAQQDAERRAKSMTEQEALLARQRAEARALIEKGRAIAAAYRVAEEMEYCPRFRHTYTLIESRICRVFGLSRLELHSNRRHKKVALARQAISYWTCRLTMLSLPEIGRRMSRDHSTCLWGRDQYPKKRAKMGRHLREVR